MGVLVCGGMDDDEGEGEGEGNGEGEGEGEGEGVGVGVWLPTTGVDASGSMDSELPLSARAK